MAALSTQVITRAGLASAVAAAAGGGDSCVADPDTFLYVKNGGGGAITVTVAAQRTLLGQAVANLAISVPAAGERMIGPIVPDLFADSTGNAQITYSGVTTVTVGAFKLSAG